AQVHQRAVVAAGEAFGLFPLGGVLAFRGGRGGAGRGGRSGVDGAHDCILAPREKMGKYREIRISATTVPTTIKIAGSIRASSAVMALARSSSKNSATEANICGSAPVPSPTSTISTARRGTTWWRPNPADTASPSFTPCTVA